MLGRILSYGTEDLYHNLAVEQAILHLHPKNEYRTTLRFWKNPKSVIIGRNQDFVEEVNEKYCRENNILIGRRISGGGTVYEDKGVLNISFFVPRAQIPTLKNPERISKYFTKLLISSLESTGINDLEQEGFSNILYQNQKISGSAGYYRNKWVLHHATLLISVNLEHLNQSLKARSRLPTKRGHSRYLPTINAPPFDVRKWQTNVIKHLEEQFNIALRDDQLTSREIKLIKLLREEMYAKKSWIFEKKRLILKQ